MVDRREVPAVPYRPEVLAVIPARGGSKGLPHKNIALLAGYPLIAYSIAAGRKAETVTRLIVSTDDAEIAAVARQYGAEVPFLRPAELAQDNSLDLPVFQHALAWLEQHEGYRPEVVVQLRPTSPLRPPTCVDDAVRLLLTHPEADSVRGVVSSGQNPYKMWHIDALSGQMKPLLILEGVAEPYNSPRQVLPKTYWQTGHIDAIRTRVILEKDSMSGSPMLPLVIDSRYAIDIDDLNTLRRAGQIIESGGLEMVQPGQLPGSGQPHRPLPQPVELIVFDFDGVMTDNRVWVDEQGHEVVAAYRSDSMGIARLRQELGIPMIVMSTEINPVVTARCQKMKLPVIQGIDDKAIVLRDYLQEHGIDPQKVVYLGNDINDIPCFPLVGCALVVADALPEALRAADRVLAHPGGHGAVRELCDLILNTNKR